MVMAEEVKTWTFGAADRQKTTTFAQDSTENDLIVMVNNSSTSGSISPTVPNSLSSSNNCCFNSTKNEVAPPPPPPLPPPPVSPHSHPHPPPPQLPPHPHHRPDITDANMPWFHGKITREDAEALLMPREDGLFLVRESTNFPGDYALCVCFNGRVEHYRVIYKDSQLTIDEEEYFDTLAKLIEHYLLDADGLCTRLRNPVAKGSSSSSSTTVNHNNHNHLINNSSSTTASSPLLDPKAFEAAGWVIRMSDLKLGEVLGKGEFGDVVLGTYRGQKVAVKKLKDSSCKAAQDYLTEASLMTSLLHRNLVQLLGVVFDGPGPTICVVTEFMAKGSLVDYLRSRGRLHVTPRDQIAFAADTCAGMAYLESRNVIHRDLAARNVLISEEGVAKVCDFGLAKDPSLVMAGGGSGAVEGGKFPIKWTAPEALRYSRFSNKSDMWSFGILLWEIYSFGRVPYPRIQLADVVKHVEKGYRMEAPEGCPPPIYEIMTQAWEISPERRPTFAAVSTKLNHMRENTD